MDKKNWDWQLENLIQDKDIYKIDGSYKHPQLL